MTPEKKIIITGTGRAGTTFLVQLLTELGLDTGYTRETWRQSYDEHCAAGLEQPWAGVNSPRILKNPAFCETLPGLLEEGAITVEHAIVPIRALEEAARSRILVGGKGRTPGGLWGTTKAAGQQAALAENFHRLVEALVAHEIPHTFLDFPRFVRDPAYTWEKLRWLLTGVERVAFDAAFARVARPELIHDFSAGLPADAGRPAREYERKRRAKRRIGRRVLGGLGALAALAGLVTWWVESGVA
jgi:hypothetical protein